MEPIVKTNFSLPGQKQVYHGKVRDVYQLENQRMAMIATDRISAFDVILPRAIPYKGQILNQIAANFLHATEDIVPNWLEAVPDPNVSIGKSCQSFKVEMVIRGYLAGHAWREYKAGKRSICGVALPDGLSQNDPLPEPIITPTTKADKGHDEDISADEILAKGLVEEGVYRQLENYTKALFARGQEMARERGLILVDTKYEFGQWENQIFLLDEIHTPDSSRYFYANGYDERQTKGEKQEQLSKEFVREWLIDNSFQGKEGQKLPEMTDEIVDNISEKYIALYEVITGKTFERSSTKDVAVRVEENLIDYLS